MIPENVSVPFAAAARMRHEIETHLENGIIPFWTQRVKDTECGGYLTNFDERGEHLGTPWKYLNSQSRILWSFSRFYRLHPERTELLSLAKWGADFLIDRMWDARHDGWFWKSRRDGSGADDGKVVYGQSFAIYAFSEYGRASGDPRGLQFASETFDLLQKYCADARYGGYYENMEPDWRVSGGGKSAGDRKSLDIHMHLMEAFTSLYEASGLELHRRKLEEVTWLIAERMTDPVTGCGRNQFDLAFNPIPAIAIKRTWNDERKGEAPATPANTTSYGHNVELAWLMRRAMDAAGIISQKLLETIRRLVDHAVENGVDWEFGGVYRDGLPSGGPLILEKEFWQNAESITGFLEAYDLFKKPEYLAAAANIWDFAARKMIVKEAGEWRTLLDREGNPLDSNIGNPWKVSYHTGRAMLESANLLDRILLSPALRQTPACKS